MRPEEFDIVRLLHPLPEYALSVGAQGTVVMDYAQYSPDEPAAYEVEFMDPDGETLAVVTVRAENLQLVHRSGNL